MSKLGTTSAQGSEGKWDGKDPQNMLQRMTQQEFQAGIFHPGDFRIPGVRGQAQEPLELRALSSLSPKGSSGCSL